MTVPSPLHLPSHAARQQVELVHTAPSQAQAQDVLAAAPLPAAPGPRAASPVQAALAAPAADTAPPAFLLCEQASGQKALLRYATITADGRSENHFPADMPEGALIDYAMREAVDAWLTQGAWTDAATCPIGLNTFVDPVIAPDGHTYEREHLVTWLGQHHTSPKTGASFLPPGQAPAPTLRLISHSTMRTFANWVRRNTDLDDAAAPPPAHVDVPIHAPAPAGRAVAAANLAGAQAQQPAVPPPARGIRRHADPARFGLLLVYSLGTLAFNGAMLGMAMSHNGVPRYLGCGLTFAAPLVGAGGVLLARQCVNRHNRRQGVNLV